MKNEKRTEEFLKQLLEKMVGNEYEILDNIESEKDIVNIRHNCKDCNNYVFKRRINTFIRNPRCPICNKNIRNEKEFKDKVNIIFGDEYEVVGKYDSKDRFIEMKHNKCGNTYKVERNTVINKQKRCPHCYRRNLKTTEYIKEEIEFLVGDEYTLIGEYTGSKNKIKLRHNCKVCNNHEYEVYIGAFKKGQRCPECYKKLLEFEKDLRKDYRNFEIVLDRLGLL